MQSFAGQPTYRGVEKVHCKKVLESQLLMTKIMRSKMCCKHHTAFLIKDCGLLRCATCFKKKHSKMDVGLFSGGASIQSCSKFCSFVVFDFLTVYVKLIS